MLRLFKFQPHKLVEENDLICNFCNRLKQNNQPWWNWAFGQLPKPKPILNLEKYIKSTCLICRFGVRRLKPKGNYQKASELGDYFWICHSLGGWVKTWFEWSEHKKPQCGAWYPWHPRLLQSWSYTRCQAARRADATCHYYSEPYKHWVRLIRLIWKLKSSLNQGLSLILEVNRLVELGRE